MPEWSEASERASALAAHKMPHMREPAALLMRLHGAFTGVAGSHWGRFIGRRGVNREIFWSPFLIESLSLSVLRIFRRS